MGTWVEPNDIIDGWIGPDVPDDEDKLDVWIERAEDMLLERVPNIEARIAALTLPMVRVERVVSAMVTRVFRNPKGERTRSSTTGPHSDSVTFGGDNPGELVLLPSELASLTPAASKRRSGKAFSISTTVGRYP